MKIATFVRVAENGVGGPRIADMLKDVGVSSGVHKTLLSVPRAIGNDRAGIGHHFDRATFVGDTANVNDAIRAMQQLPAHLGFHQTR